MKRICEKTGKILLGEKALEQAIRRVLGTRKGSMHLKRDFGSKLPDLLDQNMDEVQIFLTATILEDLEQINEFSCSEVEIASDKESVSSGKIEIIVKGKICGEHIRKKISL